MLCILRSLNVSIVAFLFVQKNIKCSVLLSLEASQNHFLVGLFKIG
jgi:hypothetical protein